MDRCHFRGVPGDPGQRGRGRAHPVADDLSPRERDAGAGSLPRVPARGVAPLARAGLALVRDIASRIRFPWRSPRLLSRGPREIPSSWKKLSWSAVERGFASVSLPGTVADVFESGSTVSANGPGAIPDFRPHRQGCAARRGPAVANDGPALTMSRTQIQCKRRWAILHQTQEVPPSRRRSLRLSASWFPHFRLGLVQRNRHPHLAEHRRRGDEMLLRLLALADSP